MNRGVTHNKMKPELIDWHCSDIENIEKWKLSDTSYFDFWIEFTIGCDQIAGDIFAAHMVTPNAL